MAIQPTNSIKLKKRIYLNEQFFMFLIIFSLRAQWKQLWKVMAILRYMIPKMSNSGAQIFLGTRMPSWFYKMMEIWLLSQVQQAQYCGPQIQLLHAHCQYRRLPAIKSNPSTSKHHQMTPETTLTFVYMFNLYIVVVCYILYSFIMY